MRFLVDASLPRSATVRLRQLGHEADDIRDLGLRSATDEVVAAHSAKEQLALLTRDFDFADIRNYPPAHYPGIAALHLPDDATAAQVVRLLEAFVTQPALLEKLAGRLAIVEPGRVRFRPA